ncbi:LOB domain-containing protein 1 [Linum perenne]
MSTLSNEIEIDDIIVWTQGVPEEFRGMAADCMSFEADARVRDPVYGCTRMIYQLQKEILMMRLELGNLNMMIALLSAQHQQHQQEMTVDDIDFEANNFGFEDCPLAPYFPPDNPQILESVHKIYGTSNLTKLLLVNKSTIHTPTTRTAQHKTFTPMSHEIEIDDIIVGTQEMPEEFRRKAADCMSFEVDARVRDPVYGCTRMIYQLQKEILMMRLELNNLNSMIALLSAQHQQHQ